MIKNTELCIKKNLKHLQANSTNPTQISILTMHSSSRPLITGSNRFTVDLRVSSLKRVNDPQSSIKRSEVRSPPSNFVTQARLVRTYVIDDVFEITLQLQCALNAAMRNIVSVTSELCLYIEALSQVILDQYVCF